MYRYGNFERAIEVGLKPMIVSVNSQAIKIPLRNNIPEFPKGISLKLLALLWDVDPETAMSAYRRCTLNCKPHNYWRIGFWCEIDVATRDIWRTIVVERQQINLVGGHCAWSHVVRCGDVRAQMEEKQSSRDN